MLVQQQRRTLAEIIVEAAVKSHVHFTPESRHMPCTRPCPLLEKQTNAVQKGISAKAKSDGRINASERDAYGNALFYSQVVFAISLSRSSKLVLTRFVVRQAA